LSLREFLAWQNAKVMVMNPVYRKASVWPRLGNTYLMSQQTPDYPVQNYYRIGMKSTYGFTPVF
jgi:hypothetical protein